jgi:hypothetical protein
MPAPIVLSGVVPSWVSLFACLAASAAAVIVVTVLFALLTQPRQPHRDSPQPRAEKPSRHALVPPVNSSGRS